MKGHFVLEGRGRITVYAMVRASARCQHDRLPHLRIVKNVIKVRGGILIQISEAIEFVCVTDDTTRILVAHTGKVRKRRAVFNGLHNF